MYLLRVLCDCCHFIRLDRNSYRRTLDLSVRVDLANCPIGVLPRCVGTFEGQVDSTSCVEGNTEKELAFMLCFMILRMKLTGTADPDHHMSTSD